MRTSVATETPIQLWGIYHLDREYARVMGDPLRTVIRAATKGDAEREAARLGFEAPWVHPVTETEAQKAAWMPLRKAHDATSMRTAQSLRKDYVQSIL